MDLKALDQLLTLLKGHGVRQYTDKEGWSVEFAQALVLTQAGDDPTANPHPETDPDAPPTSAEDLRRWLPERPEEPQQ